MIENIQEWIHFHPFTSGLIVILSCLGLIIVGIRGMAKALNEDSKLGQETIDRIINDHVKEQNELRTASKVSQITKDPNLLGTWPDSIPNVRNN